jgi:hypothetical protein
MLAGRMWPPKYAPSISTSPVQTLRPSYFVRRCASRSLCEPGPNAVLYCTPSSRRKLHSRDGLLIRIHEQADRSQQIDERPSCGWRRWCQTGDAELAMPQALALELAARGDAVGSRSDPQRRAHRPRRPSPPSGGSCRTSRRPPPRPRFVNLAERSWSGQRRESRKCWATCHHIRWCCTPYMHGLLSPNVKGLYHQK